MCAFRTRHSIVIALLLAAAVFLSTGLMAGEGYDPMRVVTLQQVHPTLMLVLDRSGSTAFPAKIVSPQGEVAGSDWSANDQDTYYYWKWYLDLSTSKATFNTQNSYTNYPLFGTPYNYDLIFSDWTVDASYMSGNGLWIKAATWTAAHGEKLPTVAVRYGSCASNETTYTIWYFLPPSRMAIMKNVLGSDVVYYLPKIAPSGQDSWGKNYYVFCGSSAPVASGEYYFDAASRSMQGSSWYNPNSAYTLTVPPQKLIERSKGFVNWGILSFASSSCTLQYTSVTPVSDDDPAVQDALFTSSIRSKLSYVSAGGARSQGGTPTRGALQQASSELQAALNSDASTCQRTYGVVLLTDGESNCGNPGDSEWGSSCPTTTASCSDCPDYPPGIADTNWTTGISKSGVTTHLRTYVIGISSDVSACELDHTAYFGRTDANAQDAGFSTDADPRLPPSPYDYAGVAGTPPHHYAFFASNAIALKTALFRILATMGVGDYTTSPPIVVNSLDAQGTPYAIMASTEFSALRGHLYAYDVSQPQAPVFVWDAGATLHAQDNAKRKIYTWNPSTNALVEVTTANAVTLDSIAGLPSSNFNDPSNGYPLIDFVRGNDGAGNPRAWTLGPILNVTPAVVASPDAWSGLSANIPSHTSFEGTYGNRHALIYVGSSDGMVHAFDLLDGKEIFALIPPNNLANEVALYNNFKAGSTVVGEPQSTAQHIYGVANSMRFSDIYWGNGIHAAYHTVLFITEGPGGNDTSKNGTTSTAPRSALYAIDVTHPYPGRTAEGQAADPNYDSANPVTPLGFVSTDNLTGLHETWSVPAVGPVANGNKCDWVCLLASGRDQASTASSSTAPSIFALDPASYTGSGVMAKHSSYSLTFQSGGVVGDQAFANSTAFAKFDTEYNPAHYLDNGVIADLNGRIWFISGVTGSVSVGINVGGGEPIYYSPAVTAYNKDSTHQYDLYAFGSGSFYEESSAVTGGSLCQTGTFCPTIYVAAGDQNGSYIDAGDSSKVFSARLTDIPIDTSGTTFSDRAQLVASPTLYVPANGVGNPFALFLVFDPGSGNCAGDSYVVKAEFDPANLGGTTIHSSDVFHASQGIAGGMATAGGSVIVSISGVGLGARASVVKVPNIKVGQASGGKTPIWWIELK